MSNNIKFYIYTAVVFLGTYFYIEYNYSVENPHDIEYLYWEILIPHYAVAFFVTFGAKWFLEYLQKSKEKKED